MCISVFVFVFPPPAASKLVIDLVNSEILRKDAISFDIHFLKNKIVTLSTWVNYLLAN